MLLPLARWNSIYITIKQDAVCIEVSYCITYSLVIKYLRCSAIGQEWNTCMTARNGITCNGVIIAKACTGTDGSAVMRCIYYNTCVVVSCSCGIYINSAIANYIIVRVI